MNKKWDMRFLELAKLVASWSKDESTRVGAVIVDEDRRIVSTGYNGFPRGVADSPELLANREVKYKLIVHAETNALLFAKRDLTGCTMYTWPFMSCAQCAGKIIQAGITMVVSVENDNPRWAADFELSKSMFTQAGVNLVLYPAPTAPPAVSPSQLLKNLQQDSMDISVRVDGKGQAHPGLVPASFDKGLAECESKSLHYAGCPAQAGKPVCTCGGRCG